MNKHTANLSPIDLTIDKTEILNPIYAASAWHCQFNPQLRTLTPDLEHTIMLKVKEGFHELCSHMGGYATFCNFNPNATTGNVRLNLCLEHPYDSNLPTLLQNIVAQALAHYALAFFYRDSYHDTAWHKCRAQTLLIFARDANHDLLKHG